MSIKVFWLDPAAIPPALDTESEVNDIVFPPKENPAGSAGNPPAPVVKVAVGGRGAREPREIGFPAKENPPLVVDEFTVGGVVCFLFSSFRILQYPANSSLKSVNTSFSIRFCALARKETLSPRRFFQ